MLVLESYFPFPHCHCHCHCHFATCLSVIGLYTTVWPVYLYKLAAQEIGLFKFWKFYPIHQGLSSEFPRHYHNVSVLESLGSCPDLTLTVTSCACCHVYRCSGWTLGCPLRCDDLCKSSSQRSRVHPVDADLRTFTQDFPVTVPVTVFMTALRFIIMISCFLFCRSRRLCELYRCVADSRFFISVDF